MSHFIPGTNGYTFPEGRKSIKCGGTKYIQNNYGNIFANGNQGGCCGGGGNGFGGYDYGYGGGYGYGGNYGGGMDKSTKWMLGMGIGTAVAGFFTDIFSFSGKKAQQAPQPKENPRESAIQQLKKENAELLAAQNKKLASDNNI